MKLLIKTLRLSNWKGHKDFTLTPGKKVTSVHGTNKAGKTTLCDAWLWLWSGKDTKSRSDFEIKTKDKNGDVEHRLDHTVIAEMEVNETPLPLSRTYKENWIKPTGEEEQILKGHVTEYMWDTIPFKTGAPKRDFEERIENLLGSIETLDLLSNPKCFLNMPWEKRRKILMQLAGVTDDEVLHQLAETNADFAALLKEIDRNDLEDLRKKIKSEKKDLKDSIAQVPIKINEAKLAIPDEPDYKAIEKQIKGKESEIKAIDDRVDSTVKAFNEKAKAVKEKQESILEKERRVAQIKSDTQTEVEKYNKDQDKELNDLNDRLVKVDTSIRSTKSDQSLVIQRIHNKETEITNQKKVVATLREKYASLNETEFDPKATLCNTCGQTLPEDKVEEIVLAFNKNKETSLQTIVDQAGKEKEMIVSLENSLNELKNQKDEFSSKITLKEEEKEKIEELIRVEKETEKKKYEASDLIGKNSEYIRLDSEIKTIHSEIKAIPEPDVKELKEIKSALISELDALKKVLTIKDTADRQRNRIDELEKELKSLSQELAGLEGKEFIADKFNRAKIEAIEAGINGLFSSIKWKMFNQLMNGSDEECCEALIDGIPYPAANNAAQINAGIECINTLSKFYDIYLPIFVDNAEAVVELISSESQIIRFVVDESCPVLTIK